MTVPATNFTALRVRRDILANSDIGAILLNKETDGPAFNRVAGVDANFRFGPSVSLNAYVAKTFSPDAAVPLQGRDYTMRDRRAATTAASGRRTARYDTIGARFNDEMGFVPRHGVDNAFLFVGRRFRPVLLSRWVRETRPHWQVDIVHAPGRRRTRIALPGLPLALHLPGRLEHGSGRQPERRGHPRLRSRSTARAASA